MNFRLEIDIKLEVNYDSQTDEIKIVSCKPVLLKKIKLDSKKTINHKITKTQLKFGILTLGARNEVGSNIPLGTEINIIVNNKKSWKITTHKTVRGRIDGLTKFYSEHPEIKEGSELKIAFDLNTLTLELTTNEEL